MTASCVPDCVICRLNRCESSERCRRELAEMVKRINARAAHPSNRQERQRDLRDDQPDDYAEMLARALAASVETGLSDGTDRPARIDDVLRDEQADR